RAVAGAWPAGASHDCPNGVSEPPTDGSYQKRDRGNRGHRCARWPSRMPQRPPASEVIQGMRMDTMVEAAHTTQVEAAQTAQAKAAQTAQAKDEFFAAGMYMFHVTGFPQQSGVLTKPMSAPPGARLEVWRTDPADSEHVPGPGAELVLLSTQGFSLANSGNRTLHAPKRSCKVELEGASHGGAHLAGMARVNLKSMYNDPSQMRESLAWRLLR